MIKDCLTCEVLVAIAAVVVVLVVFFVSATPKGTSLQRSELKSARKEVRELLETTNCGPILIRLAWHDSGTYDASVSEWPKCGGANGSALEMSQIRGHRLGSSPPQLDRIRFEPEILHGANAGLPKALKYLMQIKVKRSTISWADMMQLASAESVAFMGGPKIDMRYGRVDTAISEECPKEGNLPDGNAPFGDGSLDPPSHLRKVFHRMGFSDQEIVALSGAHTIGRAFKERSGTTEHGSGDKGSSKFTCPAFIARHDGKSGIGMSGGQSWTEKWLKFDNSYFKVPEGPLASELLRLQTDSCLAEDSSFKKYFDNYAASQEDFFADYAAAHKKLSEQGSKFEPAGGIRL